MRLKWSGCFLAWLLFFNISYANETFTFISQQDANRYAAIIQEIRCVVCQNQNIADSNAPLANDLRKKIYQMILAGRGTEEI